MKYFVCINVEFQDNSVDAFMYDDVIAQNSTEAIVCGLRKFNEEASSINIYDYSIYKVTCGKMSDLL